MLFVTFLVPLSVGADEAVTTFKSFDETTVEDDLKYLYINLDSEFPLNTSDDNIYLVSFVEYGYIEELIHDLLYPKWNEFYTQYRYNRGDVCFPVYVCHNIMAAIHNGYKKAYNLFGCNELEISVQSGKMDSEPVKDHIHLLHKKVYSDRFATDCHNGFFVPGLRETKSSFDEYLEYSDTVASIEELLYQNSYFIADMEKINLKGDKNE